MNAALNQVTRQAFWEGCYGEEGGWYSPTMPSEARKKQGVLPEGKPVFTPCTVTDTRVKDKPLSRETANILSFIHLNLNIFTVQEGVTMKMNVIHHLLTNFLVINACYIRIHSQKFLFLRPRRFLYLFLTRNRLRVVPIFPQG